MIIMTDTSFFEMTSAVVPCWLHGLGHVFGTALASATIASLPSDPALSVVVSAMCWTAFGVVVASWVQHRPIGEQQGQDCSSSRAAASGRASPATPSITAFSAPSQQTFTKSPEPTPGPVGRAGSTGSGILEVPPPSSSAHVSRKNRSGEHALDRVRPTLHQIRPASPNDCPSGTNERSSETNDPPSAPLDRALHQFRRVRNMVVKATHRPGAATQFEFSFQLAFPFADVMQVWWALTTTGDSRDYLPAMVALKEVLVEYQDELEVFPDAPSVHHRPSAPPGCPSAPRDAPPALGGVEVDLDGLIRGCVDNVGQGGGRGGRGVGGWPAATVRRRRISMQADPPAFARPFMGNATAFTFVEDSIQFHGAGSAQVRQPYWPRLIV